MRYPLHEETLAMGRSRGLSNVVDGASASVSLRTGSLLVIEIDDAAIDSPAIDSTAIDSTMGGETWQS